MLDRPCRQDAKLSAIAVLLRGMRISVVRDVHWLVAVIALKRIRGLECMSIWILHPQVLMIDMVVVEGGKVKPALGCEGVMTEVGLNVLDCLGSLRL